MYILVCFYSEAIFSLFELLTLLVEILNVSFAISHHSIYDCIDGAAQGLESTRDTHTTVVGCIHVYRRWNGNGFTWFSGSF